MTCSFSREFVLSEQAPIFLVMNRGFFFGLLPIRDFDKVGSTGVSGRFRVAERTHLWKVPWGFYSGFFFHENPRVCRPSP